jgi:hypothetical protein
MYIQEEEADYKHPALHLQIIQNGDRGVKFVKTCLTQLAVYF